MAGKPEGSLGFSVACKIQQYQEVLTANKVQIFGFCDFWYFITSKHWIRCTFLRSEDSTTTHPNVETVSCLVVSKITADGDCRHEIKTCLLLGRKVMTNLESVLKNRDITLPTKVCLAKAMVFPVVMHECESWTVKKAECRRMNAFELWCWRGLLRVPWAARRSNQSILKEISPGCSLEGLMLKLKLQYLATSCKELTHWKRPWCWEGFGAGGEGDDRGWDGWMASLTRWAWVWVNSWSWWWTGRPGVLGYTGLQRVRHDWETELNWASCVQFFATQGL